MSYESMKTIEKAARDYVKSKINSESARTGFDYDLVDLKKAFKAGVEYAQRWIKVEEGLPENDGFYIVKCKKANLPSISSFFTHSNQWGIGYFMKVTHWRKIDLI